MFQNNSGKFILICMLLLFSSTQLFALQSDKQQPVHVTSDTGHFNNATGVSIFQGHVHVVQGTSNLFADTVTLYTDKNNQLLQAIAVGTPAIYNTIVELNTPPFNAVANVIQYYPPTSRIMLIGNAKATRGPNSYTAPQIEYQIDQEIVISPPSSQGRTTIIIQPSSLKKPTSSNATTNSAPAKIPIKQSGA